MQSKLSFRAILSFFAVLSLSYFAFSFYSMGDKPWIIYNSDNGIPYFYQYIMQNHGHFYQWEFASVTNFFPEMIIFFSLATIIHHIKLTIFLFGMTQLIFYYWLMIAIAKQIVNDEEKLSLFRLSTLSGLFLLSAGYFSHKEIFESALTSWLHFGSTLMFLLGLLLILRMYRHARNLVIIFLLFLICFFSIYSDLLYITQFSIPAIVTLGVMLAIYGNKYAKPHCTLLFVIIAATLFAYLAYRSNIFGLNIHAENHLIRRFHLIDISAAIKKIRNVLRDFYQPDALILFLFMTYLLATGAYLANKLYTRDNIATVFTLLMLFSAAIVGFLSLIFLDNDLMVYNYLGLRHYQPFILFTVFLGIPIYLAKYTNLSSITHRYYFHILLVLLLCAALFTPKGSVKKLIQFYPPSVACLDQYAREYGLQNGVANYWEARSYQSLSQSHLAIVAVTAEMKPFSFTSTKEEYKNKDFTFVIAQASHTLSPSYPPGYYPDFYWNDSKLQHLLGKPIKILECPSPLADGREKIYIYKKGVINNKLQSEMA